MSCENSRTKYIEFAILGLAVLLAIGMFVFVATKNNENTNTNTNMNIRVEDATSSSSKKLCKGSQEWIDEHGHDYRWCGIPKK